ncbi:hypothetical protein CHS0354_034215 [Potamilus streckersoni]|uniref:ETS homologous factor n=1 Tax=Potamilus streckersoni TaxID=2493646 RepID=A0AAE0T2I1_9BIVA|nr:hypothetical protein CHS0354_034215 [Potamilus streckersoni]
MAAAITLQSLPEEQLHDVLTDTDVYMYTDSPPDVSVKLEVGKRSNCCEGDIPSYFDLSTSTIMFPTVKKEADEDLLSWTFKHPEHWTTQEVLDWIYWVADYQNMDCTRLKGEAFQNITGVQLCHMTLEDFIIRDPEFGNCLFEMFKNLNRDVKFIEPPPSEFIYPEYSICSMGHPEEKVSEQAYNVHSTDLTDGLIVVNNRVSFDHGEHWYDFDIEEEISKMEGSTSSSSDGYKSGSSSDSDVASDADKSEIYRQTSVDSDVFSDEESSLFVPNNTSMKSSRKKSSKSSKSSCDDCGTDEPKKTNRGRKLGQASKGNHLWEFIRDLLKDSKFNPHLLRWEDKETGVFRFVQSEAVAQMWGRKKNNPGMTYEKLSRAMRFCRSAGYFAEVPKNGKFPKKLCFRFGKKATGWND